MIGAPAFVANAALRSGAGLATVACPASIQRTVAMLCPCATTIPLPETERGMIDPEPAVGVLQQRGLFDGSIRCDAIAAGPGLDRADESWSLAWESLLLEFERHSTGPIVFDADALNAVAAARPPKNGFVEWPYSQRVVLTPHPGEMALLCGTTTADVQAQRTPCAVDAAHNMHARAARTINGDATVTLCSAESIDERPVVVLKGAGTIITDGQRTHLNRTGNAGMATGGSGDVLTGVIAGLIAQGMTRYDAAVLGVHIHGAAGDYAAKELGMASLIASDLIEYLPRAFRKHESRK